MKICPCCNTANKDEFIFCKNCGAELMQSTAGNTYSNTQEPPHTSTGKSGFSDITFDGVSYEEMQTFVGMNYREKFLSAFVKSEIVGSKVSFCLPVAILTHFFGFIGAGMWFLYRKMYKEGFLCAAVGAVINIITSLAGRGIDFNFDNLAQTLIMPTISPDNLLPFGILAAASIINISATVLFGLFAINAYKKHAVRKIKAFKSVNAEHPYYMFGLSTLGGTSFGMAIVGLLFFFIPNILITSITEITGILL